MIEQTKVSISSSNYLNFLLTEQFYKPYSCQSNLQIQLPLNEYAEFVSNMLSVSSTRLYSEMSVKAYTDALTQYNNGNSIMKLQYLFTSELYSCCIYEFKRAVMRSMDATVIILDYQDTDSIIRYQSIGNYIKDYVISGKYHKKSLTDSLDRLKRSGVQEVRCNQLSSHNEQYYFYLVLLGMQFELTKYTGKFLPANVRRGS